jgi:uncharacterized protein
VDAKTIFLFKINSFDTEFQKEYHARLTTDQSVALAMQELIDVAEFARLGRTLSGEVAVRDLLRLKDLIISGDQHIRYEISGSLSGRREPQITCIICGFVSLTCQRCLEAFDHRVDALSTLIFVSDESKLPPVGEEDDSTDYVVAESPLDVQALVEDEVILALPISPRHEPGECGESAAATASVDKPSPFAALARLKRS